MASSATGGTVDDLDASFHACLGAITNPDQFSQRDGDEVKAGVEQTVQKFLDSARQMECFFLQKRLLVSAQKPEQIVMEDNMELKNELARKDQLLEKYHAKLAEWQRLVNDTTIGGSGGGGGAQMGSHQGGPPMSQGQPPGQMMSGQRPPMARPGAMGSPGVHVGGAMMMGQGGSPGMGGHGGPPGPSMGGPNPMVRPPAMGGQGMMSPQMGGGQGSLSGPLEYLERTTSNIGMGDVRPR